MSENQESTVGQPHIVSIEPSAALPGGEVHIRGSHLAPADMQRPHVEFGAAPADLVMSSDDVVVARVPSGVVFGSVVVGTNGHRSNPHPMTIGVTIAQNLHIVTNPAVDAVGNVYATVSGSRGKKGPVAIYKVGADFVMHPFVEELMNPTSIAFDAMGSMYVSSRFEGTVYLVSGSGAVSTFAEGLGVATGLAFDAAGNLYVGDRSGTIFKVAPDRQIFVFAMLEPSISAYHLALNDKGHLFVSGPTTSSNEVVHEIDPQGNVSVFYRGLGRPQGLAFDAAGNLYVAASLKGRSGIVRITPQGAASLAVSGTNVVGIAFAPGGVAIVATDTSLHHLAWAIPGRVLV